VLLVDGALAPGVSVLLAEPSKSLDLLFGAHSLLSMVI
jgi:hypothetical protein